MKTAESKSSSSAQHLQTQTDAQAPFFQQERNGHFMERGNAPFFSTGGTQQSFFTKPTIQTKLTIGQPDDKYEQEADQMADQVVQRLTENNASPIPLATPEQSNKQVQRKPIFESNAAPTLQAKFSSAAPPIQTKCAACAEEEKLQKKEESGEDEKLQRKPIFESNAEAPELPVQTKLETPSFLQKKCDECGAEEETPGVQRAADSTGTPPSASPSLESRLSSSRGGGSPLPENTRTQMEGAFGSDFSGVRVHTDSSAVQMNNELGAQAFTHGSDVYFNAGKYDDGSTEGKRLLGHELTHVVQQGGGISKKIQRQIIFRAVIQHGFWHWPPFEQEEHLSAPLTSTAVDDICTKLGVTIHDFDDIIDARGRIYDFIGGSGRSGRSYRRNLVCDIMRNMQLVGTPLYFDSWNEFALEVRKRALTSLFMRASQGRTRGARPSGYPRDCSRNPIARVSTLAEPYWIVHPGESPDYYFELSDTGMHQATRAFDLLLFTHQRDRCLRTLMHCDYMVSALHYRAFAEAIGTTEFDRAVANGDIQVSITWDGYNNIMGDSIGSADFRSLQTVEVATEDDLIIGDHVIFYNHEAYDDLNYIAGHVWRLENAIIIDGIGANRRFQGHGYFSPLPRRHFVNAMVSKFNELVNRARRLVSRSDRASLDREFSYLINNVRFKVIDYSIDSNNRIVNPVIKYHQRGHFDNNWENNPILTMPLRNVTPADYPNPFVTPGGSMIEAYRPIESRRESL